MTNLAVTTLENIQGENIDKFPESGRRKKQSTTTHCPDKAEQILDYNSSYCRTFYLELLLHSSQLYGNQLYQVQVRTEKEQCTGSQPEGLESNRYVKVPFLGANN